MEIKVDDLSREELIDLVKKLFKEKEELERELKRYKNPNTPSSSNKHIKPVPFCSRCRFSEGARKIAFFCTEGKTILSCVSA